MRRIGFMLAVVCFSLIFISGTGFSQELSSNRVWGVGISFIPATSFEVDGFSFPSLTISFRYWSGQVGAEGAFTFAVRVPQTPIERPPDAPMEKPTDEDASAEASDSDEVENETEEEIQPVPADLSTGIFQSTFSIKGLYKFAQTPDVDFYISGGFVSRYHFEEFLVPAFRMDVGAEFNDNPNLATSWEFGYGFRLTQEGDFLDRITTGIGWGRHFYPTSLEGGASDEPTA